MFDCGYLTNDDIYYMGNRQGEDMIVPIRPSEHHKWAGGEWVLDRIESSTAIQKQLTDAVQRHMDTIAQSKGYDNLLSAVTYAEEPAVPKFQTEGIAFRAWRSQVWDYCYAQLDLVLAGEREVPTAEELIAELPVLELPE